MAPASISLLDGRGLSCSETGDAKKPRAVSRRRRQPHARVRGGFEQGAGGGNRRSLRNASARAPRRLPVPQKLLLLLLLACVLRHRDLRQQQRHHQQQQQLQQGSGALVFGWGVNAELRPESDLTSNCLDFPARNFDPKSSVAGINGGNSPYLPLPTGADAIDFTLHDLEGNPWNLRETLERTGLPVVMVWGMFTCPGFQGFGTTPPWDECGYWYELDLVERYKDRATFVHLYGPEPHPALPGTNFDEGILWQSFWSVYSQPRSYQERLEMAGLIRGLIHDDQTLLVDYLPGNPYSKLIQPAWCSYAMGARPVTIISPDGTLFFQRAWFHAGHVARAIEEYWCEQPQHQQLGGSEQDERSERVGVLGVEHSTAESEGGVGSSSWSGCTTTSDGGSHGDMGEPGIPPLAGVLSRAKASRPPWWSDRTVNESLP